jgi:DNA-binding MarR family transcriptional regulator
MQTTTRADVEAFTAALDDFWRATRRARGRYNRSQGANELTLSQLHLLDPLARAADPVPVGELAEIAGVSAPSATRMLDGLERRGLVERERCFRDRRIVRAAITPEGARLVAAKRARIHSAREAIFDQLSPAERRSAARLLGSLAAAIDELHP